MSDSYLGALPQRLLSPLGAVAIIVGIVIGAGIFKTPSMVAGITGDVGWALTLWGVEPLFLLLAHFVMLSLQRFTLTRVVTIIF